MMITETTPSTLSQTHWRTFTNYLRYRFLLHLKMNNVYGFVVFTLLLMHFFCWLWCFLYERCAQFISSWLNITLCKSCSHSHQKRNELIKLRLNYLMHILIHSNNHWWDMTRNKFWLHWLFCEFQPDVTQFSGETLCNWWNLMRTLSRWQRKQQKNVSTAWKSEEFSECRQICH